MTKKEFCALPVLQMPKMDIPACREYRGRYVDGQEYVTQYPNRVYTARMVENCLEITAYNAEDGLFLWRTWQDSDRVFSQGFGMEQSPSKATIGSRMAWNDGGWYDAPGADELIRQWICKQYWDIPKDLTGIKLAAWSQTKIRHKKRDEKWDRIRREIDNAMVEIREPVKDFSRWLTRDVFRDSHYLVYPYHKGAAKVTGFCTRCGHEVELPAQAVRNRQPVSCPRCHTTITCISEASLARTKGYCANQSAAYLQPTKEGFCLRVFDTWLKINSGNYHSPKAEWLEEERFFYSFDLGQITKKFRWEEFESSGEIRWCKWYNAPYGKMWIYPGNLKKLFAGTEWGYIPMAGLARCGEKLEIAGFIRSKGNLGIEHLTKHGLWKLAADRLWHSHENFRKAKDIRSAMGGLPMDEIRLLMTVNPDEEELNLYMEARDIVRMTPEMLRQMISMGFERNRGVICDLLKRTTWHRISRYIEEQRVVWPKKYRYDHSRRVRRDMTADAAEVASDWRDYLRDAETLGWNLSNDFILFPRNLNRAHQQTIRTLEDRKNHEMNKKLKPVLREQMIFAWKTGRYLIRPPVSAGEIALEGHTLHHCVGGYIGAVARGESIILFVREKEAPETPLVTVELDPNTWKVRQARGRYNETPAEGVQQFLRKWKRYIAQLKEARERERIKTA